MHILYIYLYTVYAHKIITYIVLEFFIQTEVQGSDYMIKIEHLTKQFDNFKFALRNITSSIDIMQNQTLLLAIYTTYGILPIIVHIQKGQNI